MMNLQPFSQQLDDKINYWKNPNVYLQQSIKKLPPEKKWLTFRNLLLSIYNNFPTDLPFFMPGDDNDSVTFYVIYHLKNDFEFLFDFMQNGDIEYQYHKNSPNGTTLHYCGTIFHYENKLQRILKLFKISEKIA